MAITGAGQVHSDLQQELLSEMRKHRTIEGKVTEEDWAYIANKMDAVLLSPDLQTLLTEKEAVRRSISLFVSSLWSQKKAKGPETSERLLKEAKSKESFAKWRVELGGEDNNDRASKALAEAAALRSRAEELERERQKVRDMPTRPVYRPAPHAPQPALNPDGTKRRRLLIVDVTEDTNGK